MFLQTAVVTSLSVGPHCVLDLALQEDITVLKVRSQEPGATGTMGYRKVGKGILVARLSV